MARAARRGRRAPRQRGGRGHAPRAAAPHAGEPPALLGALFCSFGGPRRFSAEERRFVARGLANIATLALSNARTHAEALASLAHAERLADEDALTGLPNRRVLERRIDALDAVGADVRFAVLILDLDAFNLVNAAHGRDGGDACLRAVARAIEAGLRPGDLASRIGGRSSWCCSRGRAPRGRGSWRTRAPGSPTSPCPAGSP